MPSSLSLRRRGRSWLAGCYLASPLRRRCERAGWYKRLQAPTDKPIPRTLLPISQRSRLAADIAADAGRLLPYPFTPYQTSWRDCSLLPSYVTHGLRHYVPPLTVSRGSLPSNQIGRMGEESGSSSKAGLLPQRRRVTRTPVPPLVYHAHTHSAKYHCENWITTETQRHAGYAALRSGRSQSNHVFDAQAIYLWWGHAQEHEIGS